MMERRTIHLLTALTKTKKRICLGYPYKKETLMYLRTKEEFVCPICGEDVILKLGEQRIFHFAHQKGSTCSDLYEGETLMHMEGKLQLYQWLVRQKIPTVLEYYDREINQRPDVMFMFNGKRFALEFQCSQLPIDVFKKRHNSYQQHEYHPIWILSSESIRAKLNHKISLSSFHYFFLKSTSDGSPYIPTYSPENQCLNIFELIKPITIRNAFVHQVSFPLRKLLLQELLEPRIVDGSLLFSSWEREVENFKLQWSLHPGGGQKHFLQELYSRNLNLFLLPPEIGLPVPHSIFIETPPLLWQSYLFLDILMNKNVNDLITVGKIQNQLKKRIYQKDITVRTLPQLDQIDPIIPVMEYFHRLEQFGILTQLQKDIFQMKSKINIPHTNREMAEARQIFHQKLSEFF